MAKAYIEFDLDDPEDAMAHRRCAKATDMANLIFQLVANTDIDKLTTQEFVEMVYDEGIIIDDLIK